MDTEIKEKHGSEAEPQDKRSEVSKPWRRKRYNDYSWYTKDANILKSVATVVFGRPAGLPLDQRMVPVTSDTRVALDGSDNYVAPGIMVINWLPILKTNANFTDPVNLASQNFYSFVRHMNSGSRNYERNDLLIYILAASELYNGSAEMRRLYEALLTYNTENRFYGKALVEAMGYDYEDMIKHINDLWAFILLYEVRIQVFKIPTDLSLISRHYWMNRYVWKDADVEKAQIYFYRQEGYLSFDATATGGGALNIQSKSSYGTLLTFDNLVSFFNDLINKMIDDEDCGIISGDINKAFPEGTFKVAEFSQTSKLQAVYSDEVLDQIHNTRFVGNVTSASKTGYIHQNGVAIECNPTFSSGRYLSALFTPLFDLKRSLQPERVIVATRNMTTLNQLAATWTDLQDSPTYVFDNATAKLSDAGTEVFTTCVVHSHSQTYEITDFAYAKDTGVIEAGWGEVQDTYARKRTAISAFHRAPLFYEFFFEQTNDGIQVSELKPVGEIDTFTVLSDYDLKKMHDAAVLSELGIPLK